MTDKQSNENSTVPITGKHGSCWNKIGSLEATIEKQKKVIKDLVQAITDPQVEIAGPKQRDAIYAALNSIPKELL